MRNVVPLIDQGLLFSLGAASFPLIGWVQANSALQYPWNFIAPLLAPCIVAGFIEAAAIRRTGRRRWIGSWLPFVLGLFAVIVFHQVVLWPIPAGAPPDEAMARALVMAAFVMSVPIFALAVIVIAAVAARMPGPLTPAPEAVAQPVSPQAGLELLQVLGQNLWLPMAGIATTALAALLALGWPQHALEVLGAYAIAEGTLAVTAAFLSQDRSEARWWPAKAGLIAIGVGIVSLAWPFAGGLLLVVLVAIWSIATGIFQIVGANRWRGGLANERLVRFSGFASLLFGLVPVYVLIRLIV
jgi:uncharacterized membrane protein HdeD (DUF308 family)